MKRGNAQRSYAMPDLIDALLFLALILWLGAGVPICAEFLQYLIDGGNK